MRGFFVIILFFINSNLLIAQNHFKKDTSAIVVRSFDYNELQELKKDKDFQYTSLPEPSKSLWERFWDWIWWRVHEIMRTKGGRKTVWTILIAAGIAAIVFFV